MNKGILELIKALSEEGSVIVITGDVYNTVNYLDDCCFDEEDIYDNSNSYGKVMNISLLDNENEEDQDYLDFIHTLSEFSEEKLKDLCEEIYDSIKDCCEHYGLNEEGEEEKEVAQLLDLAEFLNENFDAHIDKVGILDEEVEILKTGLDTEIEHPPHYNEYGFECIDMITYLNCNFLEGNVLKYIFRAGLKESAILDYRKALYYLNLIREDKLNLLPRSHERYGRQINEWLDMIEDPIKRDLLMSFYGILTAHTLSLLKVKIDELENKINAQIERLNTEAEDELF